MLISSICTTPIPLIMHSGTNSYIVLVSRRESITKKQAKLTTLPFISVCFLLTIRNRLCYWPCSGLALQLWCFWYCNFIFVYNESWLPLWCWEKCCALYAIQVLFVEINHWKVWRGSKLKQWWSYGWDTPGTELVAGKFVFSNSLQDTMSQTHRTEAHICQCCMIPRMAYEYIDAHLYALVL
jgi:hypothetical protein